MTVVICGGRDYTPKGALADRVAELLKELRATEVIHGGASGVDTWAGRRARKMGLRVHIVEAAWGVLGFSAGPIRNRKMAALADACIVLPGGRGTEDMARAALATGRCRVISLDSEGRTLIDVAAEKPRVVEKAEGA